MASNPLNVGTGYVVYSYDLPSDLAITLTGDVVTGDVNVPITAGAFNGYNLIGNPYASTIDWDNVVIPTGLTNAVYLTDNANVTGTPEGAFTTYVPGVAATNPPAAIPGWSGEIALGQSFWVQATGNTTLTFQESNKSTNQSVFYRTGGTKDLMRITMTDGIQKDETVLHFNAEGTLDFDPRYDAKKLFNTGINLSQYDGELDFAINTIPFDECNSSIALRVYNAAEGSYSLNFSELESFTFATQIKLIDNYLGETHEVANGYNHAFNVDANPESQGTDRFVVQFTSRIINDSPEYLINQNCEEAVTLLQDTQNEVTYSIWDGDVMLAQAEGNGGFLAMSIHQDSLIEGDNALDLRMVFMSCDSVQLAEYITIAKEGPKEITSVEGGYSCGLGEVTLTASGAGDGDSYQWFLNQDDLEPIAGEDSNQLTVSVETTTSYFVSVRNANGCESLERAEVIAEFRSVEEPEIVLEEDLLSTNAVADSYQWYKDGNAISGATSSSYKVEETGVYYVEISINDCSAISQQLTYEVLGIEDLLAEGIQIYPNPVADWLSVKSTGIIDRLIMYDTQGQVHESLNQVTQASILMTTKPSGIYFIVIQKQNRILATRIIN